jgi:hypothetical protein
LILLLIIIRTIFTHIFNSGTLIAEIDIIIKGLVINQTLRKETIETRFINPTKKQKSMIVHPKYYPASKFLLTGLLILVLFQFTALRRTSATMVVSLTIQDLVQQADLIVLGRCQEMNSAWNADRSRILTFVSVVPERCFKGVECPSPILVFHLGGTVDNVAMNVTGTPKFSEGERVFLFLKRSSATYYRVLGLAQGKFSVIKKGKTVYVKRNLTELTLVKKNGGNFQFEQLREPEKEVELETFIRSVNVYLAEK